MEKINEHIIDQVIDKIKETRIKKGISQFAIAHFLNLETSSYSKLENKQSKLTVEKLINIANYIEEPLEHLLGLKINNQSSSTTIIKSDDQQNQVAILLQETKELSKSFIHALQSENAHLKGEIEILRKQLMNKYK